MPHFRQPAFHRKRLVAFGTLMTGTTVSMLDQWQRFAERDQPLDVAAEMVRLTLRIAGQALFNIDQSDETHTVGQAVATVNKLLSQAMMNHSIKGSINATAILPFTWVGFYRR